jgi:hypothetical protein
MTLQDNSIVPSCLYSLDEESLIFQLYDVKDLMASFNKKLAKLGVWI